MTVRSTTTKLAAAATFAAMLIGVAPPSVSAGPVDDFEITLESTLPNDVTKPLSPIKPGYPPLTPTIRPANTDERPFMRGGYCAYDTFYADFHDPDGSDLRMTVEIGFVQGTGRPQVRTMTYTKALDTWYAELPSGATHIVIQATDDDGNYSHAAKMDRRVRRNDCNVSINAFGNDQDTDIFEVIGAR
jgi:hypothetical protein